MLMMKAGVFRPRRIVSLRRLGNGYASVKAEADGALTIGALAPLVSLERSDAVARHAPVVATAMRRLANIRVRNVATIGGNLAHGDPHMDLPPVLVALGASVVVAGPNGTRTVRLEDLYTGYYETALARDELITELKIPAQGRRRSAYLKCTTGSHDDWPAVGVGVSLERDGSAVRSPVVVVGAATEKVTRLPAAEAVLAGAKAGDTLAARAGEAAAAEAVTVSDVRGSAVYKRELIRVHVARAVNAALAQGGH
jgi:aerobic carbon-monoxide dehydrogenase medium subunit